MKGKRAGNIVEICSTAHFLTHHQSNSYESKPFWGVFDQFICSLM